MRTVFADSGYWIAMCNPSDELHPEAAGVTERLGPCRIVTSQMVLVEFLNYMGGRGQSLREKAMTVVTRLTDTSSVEVVPRHVTSLTKRPKCTLLGRIRDGA